MNKQAFAGRTKLYMGLSAVIILLGIVLTVAGFGIKPGMDFAGGTVLEYELSSSFETNDVQALLKEAGISDFQITKSDAAENPEEIARLQIEMAASGDAATAIQAKLEEGLKEKYPELTLIGAESIRVVADRNIVLNLLIAVGLAAGCLLVYVWLRYNFNYAATGVLALMHDMLLTCAIIAFARFFYPVNMPFVAAFLVVMPLSMINTILMFDQLREGKRKPDVLNALMDEKNALIAQRSVKVARDRIFAVGASAVIAVAAMLILGVASIKSFAFPILVGVLVSTYSSLLLTPQIWVQFEDSDLIGKILKKKNAKKAKA